MNGRARGWSVALIMPSLQDRKWHIGTSDNIQPQALYKNWELRLRKEKQLA